MDAKAQSATLRPIAEVERETGLPRATLRIWERRYGFPLPGRDERGERAYSPEQVEVLRAMRELVDGGHRPKALAALGGAEILRLAAAERATTGVSGGRTRQSGRVLRLLRAHDASGLREELQSLIVRDGLAEFAGHHLPALAAGVGHAWAEGELQVHEEHLFSDCVAHVVRLAIANVDRAVRAEAPRALLTTFPQEFHGLGLLMAHAMLALQGCPTISLGVRLPIDQIASAVHAHEIDLVGLTFTASLNPGQVTRGLEELRGLLPPRVRIWAGGNSPALRRHSIAGVRVIDDVRAVPAMLAEDFALPPLA